MQRSMIVVRALWDAEAEVWVATSEDLPGLVTEADTPQALMAKLHTMIPDLLKEEETDFAGLLEIPVMLMSEQLGMIRLRA